MLYDVFRFARGVWEAVLLPFVVLSIANLATDGWEAVIHIRDTLYVLGCFMWGCSHRSFPLSRSALEAQRAALNAAAAAAAAAAPLTSPQRSSSTPAAAGGGAASSDSPSLSTAPRGGFRGVHGEEDNDADSEAEFPAHCRTVDATATQIGATKKPREHENAKKCSGNGDDAPAAQPPLQIQRRLLLGKKGEIDEWLPAVCGRLLIPPHHGLLVSRSLHQLVSIVIGPIQQPTVSTMPTRHPEPQWPPHFLRTGGSGRGGAAGGAVGDPTTDDYSSSNSSATPNTRCHRSIAGAATRYRLASSVVYQRVSSRHLDFSNSRVPPHLIASITAHHVLSYPATRQKVLVMDLDETLCYVSTSTANMAGPPTFSEVIPTASGAELFHVWERPYARLFLATAAKLFNLVLFTSASKPYADTILQRIDPDQLLKLRFYRQDCRLVPRGLLKRMCAVAGQRGVSTGNLARQSSGDRSGAAGDTPLGPFGNAQGGHSSTNGAVGGGGGSTTNTDDESSGGVAAARLPRGVQRHNSATWGDPSTPDGKDVLSSGSEQDTSATGRSALCLSSQGQSLPLDGSGNGGQENRAGYDFSSLEKTVLNEHAKVLMKDLRILKVPPELLVMIDNSEECTLANPENALIVSPFIPSLTRGSVGEKPSPPPPTTTTAPQGGGAVPTLAPGRASTSLSDDGAATSPDTKPQEAAAQGTGSNNKNGNEGGGHAGQGRDGDGADGGLLCDDMTASDGPDDEDEVLLALLPMLEALLVVPDVRSILRLGKLY